MSEKPRPVVISPGGARRDSLVGRGHGDGAMRGLRAGAFSKIASREDAQPATDDALLPRSPTGLADGFGARECAAELALRSPRRRAVARAASLGPPLPNSQGRRGFGPIFSCANSVADPAAFCQQAGKRPRNSAASAPQIHLFLIHLFLNSSLLPKVCSRSRHSCSTPVIPVHTPVIPAQAGTGAGARWMRVPAYALFRHCCASFRHSCVGRNGGGGARGW